MTKPEQMADFVNCDITQVCREKLYLLQRLVHIFWCQSQSRLKRTKLISAFNTCQKELIGAFNTCQGQYQQSEQ